MNKIVITLSILIGVGLMFGVSQVFAYNGECDTSAWHNNIMCLLVEITEQNERILEYQEWNACLLFIGDQYTSYEKLQFCGDIP